jgi:anti-sigma factor NepR-like protein
MASEGSRLPRLIGDRLRQMFQQTVEEPLPPLILQLIRRLHEREHGEEDDVHSEPIKRIKWDLILPSARAERERD